MSYEAIPGYSGFLWLYDEAINHFPGGSLFVEVGVALGHSIAYLAETAAARGKTFELHAVDPWAGEHRNGEQQTMADMAAGGDFGLFCAMTVTHSPDSLAMIHPFRMSSAEYATLLSETRIYRPAMVLLDGDHSYETVRDEIEDFQLLLAHGGWLAGDDYDTVNGLGVMKAVDEAGFGSRLKIRGNTWVVR
jgi:cephalosporin hydroxylase